MSLTRINRLKPDSPDNKFRGLDINQAAVARFAHLNRVIDEVNNVIDEFNLTTQGESYALKNIICIEPTLPNETGRRYKTIAEAYSYLSSLSTPPSATNRWGIKISGTVTENFELKSWVYIIAEDNTVFQGEVKGGSFNNNFEEFLIFNGIYNNIRLSSTNNYINASNITIKNINADLYTLLFLNNSNIHGGDYSNITGILVIINSYILPLYSNITLSSKTEVYNSIITNFSGNQNKINIQGKNISNCSILACDVHNFVNTTNIYNSELKDPIYLKNNAKLKLYNCTTDYIEVGDANSSCILRTFGCSLQGITLINGSWNNEGDIYDKRISELLSNDVQGAIDEVAIKENNAGINYKLYLATLDNEPINDNITSGSLTPGRLYRLKNYVSGDDFTGCGTTVSGTINTTGWKFIANGNPPINWTNGSILENFGEPVAIEMVNKLSSPVTFERVNEGEYAIISLNSFTIGRTFVFPYSPHGNIALPVIDGYGIIKGYISLSHASISVIKINTYDASFNLVDWDEITDSPIPIRIEVYN